MDDRTTDGLPNAVLELVASPKALATIRRFVEREAIARGASSEAGLDLVQAVDELVTNVIKHGYRGADGVVEVEVGRADDAAVVRIRDRAPRFDPADAPIPDLTLPLARRPLGGMGVHLARELTDEMIHSEPPGWTNELTLRKHIDPPRHRSNRHVTDH